MEIGKYQNIKKYWSYKVKKKKNMAAISEIESFNFYSLNEKKNCYKITFLLVDIDQIIESVNV